MKFGQEQLEFIAKHFKPIGDIRAVRDGIVEKSDIVWWRADYGPKSVTGFSEGQHWDNMLRGWEYYQIEEPKYGYID
jgi:hypothetical protein